MAQEESVLESERLRWNRRFDLLESKNNDLEDDIAHLRDSNVGLRESLGHASARNHHLEDELSKTQADSEKIVVALAANVEALRAEMSDQAAAADKDALDAMLSQEVAVAAAVQVAREEAVEAATHAARDAAAGQAAAVEAAAAQAEQAADAVAQAASLAHGEKVAALETLLAEAERFNEATNQALLESTDQRARLATQVESYEAAVQQHQSSEAALKSELAMARSEVAAGLAKGRALTAELKAVRASASEHAASLAEQVVAAQGESEAAAGMRGSASVAATAEVAALRSELLGLKSALSSAQSKEGRARLEAQSDRDLLVAKVEEGKEEVSEVKRQLSLEVQKSSSLKTEAKACVLAVRAKEREVSKLSDELATEQEAHTDSKLDLERSILAAQETNQELNAVQLAKKQADETGRQWKQKCAELALTVGTLEGQLQASERVVEAHRNESGDVGSRLEDCTVKLSASEREVGSLKASAAEASVWRRAQEVKHVGLERELEESKAQGMALTAQVAKLQDEAVASLTAHEESKVSLSSAIESLTDAAAQAAKQVKEEHFCVVKELRQSLQASELKGAQWESTAVKRLEEVESLKQWKRAAEQRQKQSEKDKAEEVKEGLKRKLKGIVKRWLVGVPVQKAMKKWQFLCAGLSGAKESKVKHESALAALSRETEKKEHEWGREAQQAKRVLEQEHATATEVFGGRGKHVVESP
jgi:hypothetical protein